MKLKIDENGYLYIERAGKMREQVCPYGCGRGCGDWCPHFKIRVSNSPVCISPEGERASIVNVDQIKIKICGGDQYNLTSHPSRDSFIDERQ